MTKLIYFYLGLALVSLTLAAVNTCGLDGDQEEFAKKIKAILDSHLV